MNIRYPLYEGVYRILTMIRRKDTRYRLRYKGLKKGNCLAP